MRLFHHRYKPYSKGEVFTKQCQFLSHPYSWKYDQSQRPEHPLPGQMPDIYLHHGRSSGLRKADHTAVISSL